MYGVADKMTAFIEYLLYIRHHPRAWGHSNEQDRQKSLSSRTAIRFGDPISGNLCKKIEVRIPESCLHSPV